MVRQGALYTNPSGSPGLVNDGNRFKKFTNAFLKLKFKPHLPDFVFSHEREQLLLRIGHNLLPNKSE